MSALGNVIEDDENESAASLLADAIETTETEDREVNTDDVAKLAAELAAAKADRKAALEANVSTSKAHGETLNALHVERERHFKAAEDAITNGMVAAQSEVERLTDLAAKASEEGRFADAAKFTRQAAVHEFKLEGFEANKGQLAADRERIKNQPVDPEATLSPATRAWINEHPQFRTDSVYRGWATAAHDEAVQRLGLTPDTPAYFAHVNKRLAQSEGGFEPVTTQTQTPAERAAVVVDPPVTRQPNAATVAAPATRRAAPANNGNQRPGTITLTADQRDAANRMFADNFPTEKERLQHYANMQQRLKESGRLSTQGA